MYQNVFKPVIDIFISVIILLVTAPIFLLVLLLLAIANGGKPFFSQQRPGKNKRIFRIWKFKTMNDQKDNKGRLLPDAMRLTPIGRFVRKTSLDELPQLWNVIKGEMSLIGPRPLLPRYLPYFTEEENLRFTVKPGITGLAQVNGRNVLGWDKRLALDVYYVKHLSFENDIKIAWKTFLNIISSKNIIVDPQSIMLDLDEERKNTTKSPHPQRY